MKHAPLPNRILPLLLILLLVPRLEAALKQIQPRRKNNGWSDTVQGLRIKAIPSTHRIRLGDRFSLFVILQNVSDKDITLPGFTVLPTAGLSELDHPHRRSQHQYNAMLIGKPAKGSMSILWAEQEHLQKLEQSIRLAPGDLHAVVLRLATGPEHLQEVMEEATSDATRAEVHLSAAVSPGLYTLQFLYQREGFSPHPDMKEVERVERVQELDALSSVTLRTPPVFVSVLNEQGEQQALEQIPASPNP